MLDILSGENRLHYTLQIAFDQATIYYDSIVRQLRRGNSAAG